MAVIKPENLGKAIAEQLGLYHEDVTRRVNALSEKAVKDLVKKTKATAPKRTGRFRKNIASKLLRKGHNGDTYVWYVKAPDHRITHLLVHGHPKRNGGRVPGHPFLENALADVQPAYEKGIEEALKE